MKQLFCLILLCAAALLATGNTCTLVNTGSACSGSSPITCSMNGIAADSTHAYWTGTGCTASGYVPSSDYIVIPNNMVINFDQVGGTILGNSTAPTYGYVQGLTVPAGSTTGCSNPTITNTGGTAPANGTGTVPRPHITPVVSGGVITSAYQDQTGGTLSRGWYAPTSTAPTMTVAGCSFTGSYTATTAVVPNYVAGNGTQAIYAPNGSPYNTGMIITTSLTLRGDGQALSTFVMKRGATLKFDSHLSNDGFGGHYIYGLVSKPGSASNSLYSVDTTDCTQAQPCTITSDTGGAPAVPFNNDTIGSGWVFKANWTNFSYVGTYLDPIVYTGRNDTIIQHCTFDHAGMFAADGKDTTNFTYEYNRHTNPAGVSDLYYNNIFGLSTGTRNIRHNVFATCVGAAGAVLATTNPLVMGCSANGGNGNSSETVEDNYFPAANPQFPGTVASFKNNFLFSAVIVTMTATRSGNYYWVPVVSNNPHIGTIGNQTVTGEVFDIAEDITGGDASPLGGPALGSGAISNMQNIFALASKQGHGNGWMALIFDGSFIVGNTLNMNHNTWWGRLYGGGYGGNSMLSSGHNTNCAGTGTIGSFKSNLVYGLGGTNTTFKFGSVLPGITVCANLCTATNCDYNAAYNFTPTAAQCTACVPAGGVRGYQSNSTGGSASYPGQHDIDNVVNPGSATGVNPYFVDPMRNIYLWDTKYLGKAVNPAWISGIGYTAGVSAVSASHAGIYTGATINYNCITSHVGNSQTEPDGTPYATTDLGSGLTSVVVAGGIATATVTSPHQLSVGMPVNYAGIYLHYSYAGPVLTVPNSTTITFAVSGTADGTYTTGSKLYIWQAFWEPASLEDLRSAIVSPTVPYNTDPLIGCGGGCTAMQALGNWVKTGFTPQNTALWCSGVDGETTGAVPFCQQGKATVGAIF